MDDRVEKIVKALNQYFKRGEPDYAAFVVVLSVLLLLLLFFYISKKRKKNIKRLLSKNDLEVLEMVSSAKKISASDRDFLLAISAEQKIKPIYLPFIDQSVFIRIEKSVELSAKLKKQKSEQNRLVNLRRIKKILF